tara:strand:- start:1128 stop:2309 length:1182 start_codon:yes stop_codon:yes gene_type:complete
MTNSNFHEKISLSLILLILSNYLFLSINVPEVVIKINFVLFLLVVVFFYFKNFLDNPYLKIFFTLFLIISFGTPLYEWDPRSIWLFHAKRIFYDYSIFSIVDNYAKFSHNDYPSLAPAFSSSFAILIGYWNEVFPKISFLLMFLPPLIFTYSFLKHEKYLIFLSIVFFIIGKYLFNGWADGLIAIYFCISAFLMYYLFLDNKQFIQKSFLNYLIAFCFFISLSLIKNEGTALLLILFFVTFIIGLSYSGFKKNISKFIYLSFSFIPIIFWKVFCYSNEIHNDYINDNILLNLLPRLGELNNYKLIGYFLLLNEKFLISLIFFILAFWIRRNNQLFSFVTFIVTTYIFVLFFIFLSTPVDFYFQLDSAAARVIKTVSFTIAFFGLINLCNNKIS